MQPYTDPAAAIEAGLNNKDAMTTKRTFDYIVYRHGSNGANQPMTPRVIVGVFSAPNGPSACQQARERCVFYANQHSTCKPLSRASAADRVEIQALAEFV
jgi:hypothetical protein